MSGRPVVNCVDHGGFRLFKYVSTATGAQLLYRLLRNVEVAVYPISFVYEPFTNHGYNYFTLA